MFLTTGVHPADHEAQLKEIAQTLTVHDVASFLEEIKLGQYRGVFEEEEVDGDLLRGVSEDAMKDLGVTNAFHRRKIVKKFEVHLNKLLNK